jgi:multiple sugar transport system permease protein
MRAYATEMGRSLVPALLPAEQDRLGGLPMECPNRLARSDTLDTRAEPNVLCRSVPSWNPHGVRMAIGSDRARERRQDQPRFELSSALLLSLPASFLLFLFVVPILYALYLGFTNLQLVGPHAQSWWFTGLANPRRLLHDSIFFHSIRLTLIFVVGSGIIGQTVLGLTLALLMRRTLAPIRLSVGILVVTAWVIPEVTAAFIWYAFSQAGGPLGVVFGEQQTNFLFSAPIATVSVANLWRGTAFCMLVFAAALRNLPSEVLEAADVEGASAIQQLFSITLPLLGSTILTNLLLVTILNLSDFTLIYTMTQGGPGTSTMTLPVYIYQEAFTYYELGYGTTISLVLIAIGAILSLLFVRQARVRP